MTVQAAATPRIACIGAGAWGMNLVRNFDDLGALAWVCESDAARREQMRQKHPRTRVTGDMEEVLRDQGVAGVVIATPAETHGSVVRRALEAGKDVFVEKPLCLGLEEGQALVGLAEQKGRILMVGHLLWYHPAVLKLRALIEAGELGRIRYIYSNRLNLGRIRREENILWSFAPHDISVILGLVGELPELVQAQGGNYLHEKIADVTTTLLGFPSGVKAHIFVSWLHPFKEQKLVVVGERQMAVFDDVQPEQKLVVYRHAIDWRNNAPIPVRGSAEPVAVEPVEPLRAECEHFLECMRTRQRPRTDGAEGLRVLGVLHRCQVALEVRGNAHEAAPGAAAAPAAPYFAHASAFIDEDVEIGEGTTIWHVSHVMKGSRIGKGCRIGQNVVIGPKATIGDGVKIQNNVSVYEGVTLEDHVFCGPSMVFTNVYNPRSEIRRMDELRPTVVRRGASFGANCTVVCGITVGQYAFVGAGAVVTRDVPDFALVLGNPGRVAGWMCVCGSRLRFEADGEGRCPACSRTYRKVGTQVELIGAAEEAVA